ncbi:MAG: ATP-binding cassette domain-containing protein [Thermoplasmata archaeon]|nr:ATP-binding cassette domain-containing protein [Thermoplasmata archaeon]
MSDDYILEARGVSYTYSVRQDRPSLDDVSVRIRRGSRTAILGANGAGKSTLFYHFNGVYKPKSGTVLYNGEPLSYEKADLRKLRSDICVVVQNPDEQIFSSTVEEDVAFGPMNMGMERDEIERRIQDALFKVGMEGYRKRPSTQLSYGQRKRVSIAGALAVDPKVLILDEPTAGLDPQMAQEVMELVDQLVEAGTTVLISTHDVDLAYTWAEEVHVIRRGKAVFSGSPEEFFSDSARAFACGLTRPTPSSVDASLCPGSPHRPRTCAQLLCSLAPEGAVFGKVRIVPVDADTDVAAEVGNVPDDQSIGVYGAIAHRAFSSGGLRVDHGFNAIEGCMTDAIRGKDSVLFCDSNMVPLAKRRGAAIEEYGKGAVM